MKKKLIKAAALLAVFTALVAYALLTPAKDNPIQDKFLQAARCGNVSELQRLHSAGAVIGGLATYEHGAVASGPALYDAIDYERAEAVRWLLDHGANANLVVATETPLEIAEHCSAERPGSQALRDIVALLRSRRAKRLSEL